MLLILAYQKVFLFPKQLLQKDKIMNSEQFINYLIDIITTALEELKSERINDFIHGEMTAYVDVLEQIQLRQKYTRIKLDYVICKRYKI